MSDHIPDATKMISDTPRMQSALLDHPDAGFANIWKVGCDIERELNAANAIIRQQQLLDEENLRLQDRIKRLEEMYEGEIGENEQFLGSNLQGLLTRELNWSKDRIKRLEESFTELEQCNLTDENCANMDVATRRIRNFARRAKEAKL